MTELSPGEKHFYKKLTKFEKTCVRMVDNGQPYLAVILCHELHRFLWPSEPYANFVHDDPVVFMNRKIDQLLELGDHFSDVVVPYKLRFDIRKHNSGVLEKDTSDLYSSLWKSFNNETLTKESIKLIKNRLPDPVIKSNIKSGRVLDMGCGSGRYSIALASLGAKNVYGIDFQGKAFRAAQDFCKENKIPVTFQEGNVLELPFEDEYFDFVFCNGVIHHSSSMEKGLQEIYRVLKPSGNAFLFVYGAGGFFWNTRAVMRNIFNKIPLDYTKEILNCIGMPSNRFIFCDTWYVPVERLTTTKELHEMLDDVGFSYKKIIGKNSFDLDNAIDRKKVKDAKEMWGDGDHRYILSK